MVEYPPCVGCRIADAAVRRESSQIRFHAGCYAVKRVPAGEAVPVIDPVMLIDFSLDVLVACRRRRAGRAHGNVPVTLGRLPSAALFLEYIQDKY